LVPSDRPAAERLLGLSAAERSKLGPDECADACVALSVYAAFLTRLAQAQEAEAFLCAERLDRILLPAMGGYAAFSFQERRALALAERPHADALDLERIAAAAKAKRLLFFANRVEAVAKAFGGLGNARRRGREFGD
jgi:hypothetical protein